MKYGEAPCNLGACELLKPEYMYTQYMPIKMAGSFETRIPPNLKFMEPLLVSSIADKADYVYVTAKHTFVAPGTTGNRPDWHADGFGSNDMNYLWSDSVPTEFCVQDFNLSDDHIVSMQEMKDQAREENIITYPNKTLLLMDQSVIHRCGISEKGGFRLFVKISVSKHQYRLAGNAHNYMFDYDWDMVERSEIRNDPITS